MSWRIPGLGSRETAGCASSTSLSLAYARRGGGAGADLLVSLSCHSTTKSSSKVRALAAANAGVCEYNLVVFH